ncbi:MAG: hypothetical protein A2138_26095 [Deltaproteobacteria bacterium RBG_16_71_12]|nr:MAG: hypothetical protein A2138_26095 [Deltaproteobacteria bacterium RBG_16_71_12]
MQSGELFEAFERIAEGNCISNIRWVMTRERCSLQDGKSRLANVESTALDRVRLGNLIEPRLPVVVAESRIGECALAPQKVYALVQLSKCGREARGCCGFERVG